MFYEGRRRERERERERVVVVVKVVVECALVLKKKKEDDCDEINCRLVFFLHSVLLLGNCESKKNQKGQKEMVRKFLYDKRFDFRQVITNK